MTLQLTGQWTVTADAGNNSPSLDQGVGARASSKNSPIDCVGVSVHAADETPARYRILRYFLLVEEIEGLADQRIGRFEDSEIELLITLILE